MTYYTGDNVPLKFTCAESGSAVTPTAADVTIYKPDGAAVAETAATINSDEVSYTVPTSVTTVDGEYKAYFALTLSSLKRTHMMTFRVVSNP